MTIKNKNESITKSIINWYSNNKRDLPWRKTKDPYKIWISEIILQQTRVNQGLAYFIRFIERFPTINELSIASEDEVLKYWQGLGYYSRARNLHKASKQITNEYNGIFPNKYNEILKLSGIGEYTAAAISSFAYNLPYAVLDGNVYRILSRFFGIYTPIDSYEGKREFSKLANQLLPSNEAEIYNQAIMDFGALQCTPGSTNCVICPLKSECFAYKLGVVDKLPIKSQKNKTTNRYFNYLYINLENDIFLQKRIQKDIWLNLYEFPLIESDNLLDVEEIINHELFKRIFEGINDLSITNISIPIKHILSHQHIYARFFTINIKHNNNNLKKYIQISKNEIDKYAVSRLIESFLEVTL